VSCAAWPRHGNSRRQPYRLRAAPNARNNPSTEHTIPPTRNQTDLFVGDPLKNRDTSEANDCEALIPRTINAIPPPRSASPSSLFSAALFMVSGGGQRAFRLWAQRLFLPAADRCDQAATQLDDRGMIREHSLHHPNFLARLASVAFLQPGKGGVDVPGVSLIQRTSGF